MRHFILALAMVVVGGNVNAQVFVEGEHYQPVSPPQSTRFDDKVEVVEVFSYACGGCAAFQPYFDNWMETMPENVDFKRMPVVFRPNWEPLARAYYIAELLKVLDTTHGATFDGMHKERRNFFDPGEVKAFFLEQGIDEKAYDDMAKSFAVETRMRRGDQLVRRYGVQGTPSLVVNGKWRISGRIVGGGNEKLLEVLDYLIAMETDLMAQAAAAEASEQATEEVSETAESAADAG